MVPEHLLALTHKEATGHSLNHARRGTHGRLPNQLQGSWPIDFRLGLWIQAAWSCRVWNEFFRLRDIKDVVEGLGLRVLEVRSDRAG